MVFRLATVAWMLQWQHLCVSQMTLDGFSVEGGPSESETFRGDPPGNIWNTPIPGMNILECGAFGNRENIGDRATINAGSSFKLDGSVYLALEGTGSIYLSIKYGEKVAFYDDGIPLGLPWDFDSMDSLPQTFKGAGDPYRWSITNSIPEDAYASPATIQVEYATPHTLRYRSNVTVNRFYQCIDIDIGVGEPVPPGGFPQGGGGAPPTPAPGQGQGQGRGQGGSDANSASNTQAKATQDFTIVLISLVCVMVAIFLVILFIKCKKKEDDEHEYEEQYEEDYEGDYEGDYEEMDEQQALNMTQNQEENVEEHKQYRNIGDPIRFNEHELPEDESSEDLSEVYTKPADKGRNFHFHYVEGEDDVYNNVPELNY